MTAATIDAQLDAHDVLVRACLEETLAFWEFTAAYGTFPSSLRAAAPLGSALTEQLRQRLAFHAKVAGVLAGASNMESLLSGAILLRLRHLTSRYPDFSCSG